MVINMLKIEKDYKELYGDIPSDYDGRMDYLLDTIKPQKFKESVYDYIGRINKEIISIKL